LLGLSFYINLIPYVRDGDVQIQTDGLCPFENESPTGNLKKLTQVYTDTTYQLSISIFQP